MESRKRKEAPEGAGEEPPAKTAKEEEKAEESTETAPAAAAAAPAAEAAKTETSADAAATEETPADPATAVDAAALPENGTPAAPAETEGTVEMDTSPKVLSKPSSPEELAHWNQMFFDLMRYRISNGNVNVKSTDRKNAELYKWIVQLRKDYKTRERDPSESTLTQDQITVLESVRFAFTTRGEEHWQKNYLKLKEYKADHGHVLVPRQCEIPGLGDWVTSQRQQYQEYTKGRPTPLTKQRKELLDEIGFQFRIRNRPEWMSKFEELLEYKEKHGDTRVPQHFKANKALGKWVAKQREQFKLHKKGKHSFLTPDRLEKLNAIGFVWSVRGDSSTATPTKAVANAAPETKVESTASAVVDDIMAKPAETEQEGEEKKAVKEEAAPVAAAAADTSTGENAVQV